MNYSFVIVNRLTGCYTKLYNADPLFCLIDLSKTLNSLVTNKSNRFFAVIDNDTNDEECIFDRCTTYVDYAIAL